MDSNPLPMLERRGPLRGELHADAQKQRSRENAFAGAESAIVELQWKKVAGFLKVVAGNY